MAYWWDYNWQESHVNYPWTEARSPQWEADEQKLWHTKTKCNNSITSGVMNLICQLTRKLSGLWSERLIYRGDELRTHLYKYYRVLVDLAVATSFVSWVEDKTSWSRHTTGNMSDSCTCTAFLYHGILPSTALSLRVQVCVFSAKNQYPLTTIQRFTGGHNQESTICGLLPHLIWASWGHWEAWRSVSS